MIDEAAIRLRWETVGARLDERGRRLFAAAEVRSAGRGGLALVSKITGLARSTINRGEDDLDGEPLAKGRVRRAGGGRRSVSEADRSTYCSGCPYVRVNRAAVREMHRQVGDLEINAAGLAERGLLVRHLALPNGLAGTEAALRFLAEEISSDTYLNVMGQYRPCYRAEEHPGLERPISGGEFSEALAIARRCGLHPLDHGSGRL